MAISGIDAVVYDVSDMERSRRYFSDWGLRKAKSGKSESILTTAMSAEVIRKTTTEGLSRSKALPPTREKRDA